MKLADIIGNINSTESLQDNIKQFASRIKGSPLFRPSSCLDYTSIIINLLLIGFIKDNWKNVNTNGLSLDR